VNMLALSSFCLALVTLTSGGPEQSDCQQPDGEFLDVVAYKALCSPLSNAVTRHSDIKVL
jgi:hypothetical protein